MTISIRALQASDHDAWLELFRGYINFYEAKVPDDVVELTWQRLLGEKDGFRGLVAVDETDAWLGIGPFVDRQHTFEALHSGDPSPGDVRLEFDPLVGSCRVGGHDPEVLGLEIGGDDETVVPVVHVVLDVVDTTADEP